MLIYLDNVCVITNWSDIQNIDFKIVRILADT